MMIRRNYKDFKECRVVWDEWIAKGFPAERIGGEAQANYIRHVSGGEVMLIQMERAEDADDWQGNQFNEITIDDAGTMGYVLALIDKLTGINRSPGAGLKCTIFVTSNPGGPGHVALKTHFVDVAQPFSIYTDLHGLTRCYIPSVPTDNPTLMENDPRYLARLAGIADPVLKAAWLRGDWSVMVGQAFPWDVQWHVLPDCPPVPPHAPLLMTFDYGFGKPFSVGWWWVDPDGRLYRFAEWYGSNGQPDVGLRLTDGQIADGIIARERELGLTGRDILRLAGPDCWSKHANFAEGGQSPSTATTFASKGLFLTSGDPSRDNKFKQFRGRMQIHRDEQGRVVERPMLVVYPTCKDFIRTVPSLSLDEKNKADVDTSGEDHIYDEACHAVMRRPLGAVDHLHQPATLQRVISRSVSARPV